MCKYGNHGPIVVNTKEQLEIIKNAILESNKLSKSRKASSVDNKIFEFNPKIWKIKKSS